MNVNVDYARTGSRRASLEKPLDLHVADGFFDPSLKTVADFQIFRREPAAQVLRLKVGVEALSEFLVLGGIADEARIELDGVRGS